MSDHPQPTQRKLSQARAIFSLGNERLFLIAVAFSIVPLWFGQYLPAVDLPQHAGQIAALREILSGNAQFSALFEVNWFTPYLLGYLLLYLASAVLPITVAAKLIVSIAVVSVPLLTGALLRAADADQRWKWLAIPGSYSFALYWGFLSFMVAAPVALLFLVQTFRFARDPTLGRGAATSVFAVLLFFCHVIVLGFALIVGFAHIAGRFHRDIRGLVLRCLPLALPLPLIAAWWFITSANEPVLQDAGILYGPLLQRFAWMLIQPSGLDEWSYPASALITAAILLVPPLCGARFSRSPERWLPLVSAIALFFAVPAVAMGTAFLYQRLGIFLVPLWLLAWDAPSDVPRRFEWVAMPIVLLWLTINTGRFASFARETESFDGLVSTMPVGCRVAAMVFENRSQLFSAPVYLHFPVWYQATHRGVVDFNFADFPPQWVRYKQRTGARITDLLGWYPTMFEWETNGGNNYDYFIVKSSVDISSYIFKDRIQNVRMVARSGWWWLYRNSESQDRINPPACGAMDRSIARQ